VPFPLSPHFVSCFFPIPNRCIRARIVLSPSLDSLRSPAWRRRRFAPSFSIKTFVRPIRLSPLRSMGDPMLIPSVQHTLPPATSCNSRHRASLRSPFFFYRPFLYVTCLPDCCAPCSTPRRFRPSRALRSIPSRRDNFAPCCASVTDTPLFVWTMSFCSLYFFAEPVRPGMYLLRARILGHDGPCICANIVGADLVDRSFFHALS